jgi:hypothetical protein
VAAAKMQAAQHGDDDADETNQDNKNFICASTCRQY